MNKAAFLVLVVVFLSAFMVDAYTISRNRVMVSASKSNVTVLAAVEPSLQNQINSLRPSGESWVYQAGYQDAIKDIKRILGMSSNQFNFKPSYAELYRNNLNPEFKTCFCYNSTYADLIKPVIQNLSRYNITLTK